MNLVSRFSCHCPSLVWDLLLIYIYDYFCVHVNTHTQHLCFHHYMIALLPWIPPCTQLRYIPSLCPSPSALCSAGALCSTWLASSLSSSVVCVGLDVVWSYLWVAMMNILRKNSKRKGMLAPGFRGFIPYLVCSIAWAEHHGGSSP